MKTFSYGEYIKCIHTLRLNAVLQLAEESTEYHLNQPEKKYSHGRLVKNILEDKKEAAQFINQFVEPREKIKEEELIRCNKYKSKKADLVYKLNNREIFFLIEHLSTINNSMPYRILNECLDIMQEWSKDKKIRKNTGYPIVVPIIIYTGNQKWKIQPNFKEKHVSRYVFDQYKIDLAYNLIDINKISEQRFLAEESMFGYMMCLEKSKNQEELIRNLDKIIQSIKGEEELRKLANIINDLFDHVLEENRQEELLKKIRNKMQYCI